MTTAASSAIEIDPTVDTRFMALALALGRRGLGNTWPNPAVGAVIVRHEPGGHVRRMRDGRPHVLLKLAVSADGKAGLAGRRPAAITGEAARDRVHLLRSMHDGILVGIGTVLADDPALTCRLPGMAARSPVRIVLDRELRLPLDCRLVRDVRATPVWVMAGRRAPVERAQHLRELGVEVIEV